MNAQKNSPMKKLISVFGTLAIVFTMNSAKAEGNGVVEASNSNAVKREILKKELNRELSRNVVFPYLEREHNMHGTVLATFVVDNEGKLEILDMKSTNPELSDYVRGKLDKVDLEDNNGGIWRKTTIRFVFKKEA